MRGGVGQENIGTLQQLGFNQEQIDYLLETHPDMDVVFLQNSVNGVPNSIFFPNPQNPDQIITALQAIDADIDNANESLNTTRDLMSQYSNNSNNSNNSLNNSGFSNISSIPGDSDNEIMDISFDSNTDTTPDTTPESIGGKRRTLSKQNKRKTKKSKKTRKHRKRRQRGGNMTVTEDLTLQNYKDDEYNQMKDLRLYSKQWV